jgi:hypothetical protein
MPVSFFIIPMEGLGTRADPRREKYVPALGVDRAIVDHDDTAIVWANTTPAQDAALALHADVILVPALDLPVALVTLQTALEALNIPAQWITAAMTNRDVLRALVGMAQLLQRCTGLGVSFKLAGNLDLTMSQLSVAVRTVLASASDSLGLDRSTIVGTTTVRQALRILGKQFLDGRGVQLADL